MKRLKGKINKNDLAIQICEENSLPYTKGEIGLMINIFLKTLRGYSPWGVLCLIYRGEI